ncbi:low molecular weight phosphotyrosine protein phosphatase [Jatrophihabitans telluris]|uniref:protein-tyrosine-phosphatase n=1 Tax=Jatrophihabitans telluris TaxID=2038343 RepID=A0ABY4QZB4_9ACTN|nr:low molecular weight phosphotyrosine protein phosphatase [Jatrophihabitans telluris]
MRTLLDLAGLSERVVVDSAGTGEWHVGDDMDARSRSTLARHGYEHPPHTAKQFSPQLFAERDLVVAIDHGHLSRLTQLARVADDPPEALDSLVLLRSFDPLAVASGDLDVPDPYYGGGRGFDEVLAQTERACAGLLTALAERIRRR